MGGWIKACDQSLSLLCCTDFTVFKIKLSELWVVLFVLWQGNYNSFPVNHTAQQYILWIFGSLCHTQKQWWGLQNSLNRLFKWWLFLWYDIFEMCWNIVSCLCLSVHRCSLHLSFIYLIMKRHCRLELWVKNNKKCSLQESLLAAWFSPRTVIGRLQGFCLLERKRHQPALKSLHNIFCHVLPSCLIQIAWNPDPQSLYLFIKVAHRSLNEEKAEASMCI